MKELSPQRTRQNSIYAGLNKAYMLDGQKCMQEARKAAMPSSNLRCASDMQTPGFITPCSASALGMGLQAMINTLQKCPLLSFVITLEEQKKKESWEAGTGYGSQ